MDGRLSAVFESQGIPLDFDFMSNPRHYTDEQCDVLLRERQ